MVRTLALMATLAAAAGARVRMGDGPEFVGLDFFNSSAEGTANLVMLDGSDGAVCLDGSPAGFYFEPGTGAGQYNWQIYFQGGGWCYNLEDCWGRSNGNLGSSKAWPKTMSAGGVVSDDPTTNPTFGTWNKVLIPYCDGNSFSGMLDDPVVVNGKPLYFRGRRILTAVLNAVKANVMAAPVPFTSAFDVVLTGCSAGGLSTFIHANQVGDFLPAVRPPPTGGPNRNGVYASVPISGGFLLHNNVAGESVYPVEIQSIHAISNASFGVDEDCVRAQGAALSWRCNFAAYSFMYERYPVFVLNSHYDSWSTGCVLTPEYVSNPNSTANGNCSATPGWQNCGQDPTKCTPQQIDLGYNPWRQAWIADFNNTVTARTPGVGGFITSCHTHCEGQSDAAYTKFAINGVVMRDAVDAWWKTLTAGAPPTTTSWSVDCQYSTTAPYACNPSCS